ncbi:MAG: leucyl aminopeptidase [Pirellulales bacterium]
MNVHTTNTPLTELDADAIVVPLFADNPSIGPIADLDRAAGGLITRLLELKELTGKKYELVPLLGLPGVRVGHVLILGLGERESLNAMTLHRACAAASRQLAGKERANAAFYLGEPIAADQLEHAVAGAIVGCQGQDLYRTERKRHPFAELLFAGVNDGSILRGRILGESMNLARRLVNEPPQEIYPESFAARAREVAQSCGLEIDVWDEKRLEQERCGSLLAVARGSNRAPRLVILRYRGAAADAPTLAIVGKGVTFDSGGLSLKTPEGMLTMKCDMAGAATMLAAMQAIAQLKLPCNVVGLAGLVENMTGPGAYKLGDVLHARSGKTIEVHNTDAEGRLVLADVLNVAVETGAAKIIDLATLTGACVVALGQDVVGVMTNDQSWCDTVMAAAGRCGEPCWQLPMFPEYDEQIKSEVADIKNVGEGRWGGAISAAKFLEQFVEKKPWVHLDIAGPAFVEKPKPWTDGGASGVFVRTLVEIARGWK